MTPYHVARHGAQLEQRRPEVTLVDEPFEHATAWLSGFPGAIAMAQACAEHDSEELFESMRTPSPGVPLPMGDPSKCNVPDVSHSGRATWAGGKWRVWVVLRRPPRDASRTCARCGRSARRTRGRPLGTDPGDPVTDGGFKFPLARGAGLTRSWVVPIT